MAQLVWLVTGCSSGLGEAFVHALLARGDKVIATGRKAEPRLAHLNETGAAIMDLDVTVPQAELNKKITDAIAVYGKIDGLINNAGYIEFGFIEELSFAQTLNDEVAQFNTHATIFDIGHFRTLALGENMKLTHPKIEDYNGLWGAITGMAQTMAGNQPGDPKKGVERMVDVLKQEGMAKGMEVPGRVQIGRMRCRL